MARTRRDSRLDTRQARLRLTKGARAHWTRVAPGLFLGYRRTDRGSSWIARTLRATGAKAYVEQRIGAADDYQDADGVAVLTYRQAIKRAQAVADGVDVRAPKHHADGLTVGDCVSLYVSERLAPRAGKAASGFFATHGAPIAGIRVRALRAEHLRRWHAGMATSPPMIRGPSGTRKALPFDPSDPDQSRQRKASANRVLTVVKAALNFAWREDRLPGVSPEWDKVQPFTKVNAEDDRPPRMLDPAEIARLLNAAPPDFRNLLRAALLTGARYGEIAGLKVRDFDPQTGRVRIHQSKTGKTLSQPLTAEGVAFFGALTAGLSDVSPILTRADGRPWQRGDQARPMRETVARAALPGVTFKTTRATYGKLLLLATRDLEQVAKALGHSDSRITRKHYAALLPDEVAAGIARMPAIGIEVPGNVTRMRVRE